MKSAATMVSYNIIFFSKYLYLFSLFQSTDIVFDTFSDTSYIYYARYISYDSYEIWTEI